MHLYNLILAGAWLALGVWLIVADHVQPAGGWTIRVGEARVSVLGCLALVFVAYNLVRWWTRRKSERARSLRDEAQRRRELAERERAFRESGRERDPNFIFDESPRRET